jgi:hypothetical protein
VTLARVDKGAGAEWASQWLQWGLGWGRRVCVRGVGGGWRGYISKRIDVHVKFLAAWELCK